MVSVSQQLDLTHDELKTIRRYQGPRFAKSQVNSERILELELLVYALQGARDAGHTEISEKQFSNIKSELAAMQQCHKLATEYKAKGAQLDDARMALRASYQKHIAMLDRKIAKLKSQQFPKLLTAAT